MELDRLTPQEEHRLLSVYRNLCYFHDKYQLQGEYEAAKKNEDAEEKRLNQLRTDYENRPRHKKTSDGFKPDQTALNKLKEEKVKYEDRLRRVVEASLRNGALIRKQDVLQALKVLGYNATELDVETMIWEVDENLDGKVDWDNFQLMYHRNLTDKTGLEPSRFFNLIQFMIYDENENGLVSVDETMIMLYARYGRGNIETKLRELFGTGMKESGKQGGEITFGEYITAVNRLQNSTFWNSNMGELVMTSSATPPSQKLLARKFINKDKY